jgi:polyisoprenoid-binding protein YceI
MPATDPSPAPEPPAAGEWVIDPGQADVSFVGRRFMLAKVRGRFTDVTGVVRIADDPAASSVEVVVATASISSGSADRDEHLRSADLLDVGRFPVAAFRSRSVRPGMGGALVEGDLTIVGVTRPVVFRVTHLGVVRDPWGHERALFSAATEVNREDWGISWNVALDAGGVLVSKKVRIEVEVETVRSGIPASGPWMSRSSETSRAQNG